MWQWFALAVVSLSAIWWQAPQQVEVLLWTMLKISFGAGVGYWLDRTLFPRARPHECEGIFAVHARYRRAAVVAAVLVSMGLSV